MQNKNLRRIHQNILKKSNLSPKIENNQNESENNNEAMPLNSLVREIAASREDNRYEKLFRELLDDIISLGEDPISYLSIEKPVILPSGNTIDEITYKNLVKHHEKDPFSKEYNPIKPIANCFARKLFDIQEKYKDSL